VGKEWFCGQCGVPTVVQRAGLGLVIDKEIDSGGGARKLLTEIGFAI